MCKNYLFLYNFLLLKMELDFSVFKKIEKEDSESENENFYVCQNCNIALDLNPAEAFFVCRKCGIIKEDRFSRDIPLYQNKEYVGYKLKNYTGYNHMLYFKRRLEYIDGNYKQYKNIKKNLFPKIKKKFKGKKINHQKIRNYLRRKGIKNETKNINVFLKHLDNDFKNLHFKLKSDIINIYQKYYNEILLKKKKTEDLSIIMFFIVLIISKLSRFFNIKLLYNPKDYLKYFKKPSQYLIKKYALLLIEELTPIITEHLTHKLYNDKNDLRGRMEIKSVIDYVEIIFV